MNANHGDTRLKRDDDDCAPELNHFIDFCSDSRLNCANDQLYEFRSKRRQILLKESVIFDFEDTALSMDWNDKLRCFLGEMMTESNSEDQKHK